MFLLRVAALILVAGALSAAEPSGFAGVWRLNLALSRMTDGKALLLNKSHTLGVVLQGASLRWHEHRITSDGAMLATYAQATPGGGETELIGFGNGKATPNSRISIVIDGNRLVQKFHGTSAQGQKFSGTRTLTISADGKSLTATVAVDRYGVLLSWTETWDRL